MLAARGARRLMKFAERLPIDMARNRVGWAIAPPTLPTSGQVMRSAIHVITGCAAPGARWAKWLPIAATDEGICKTRGSPTGSAGGQPYRAGQAVTHVAGQSMLAAKRVTVAGAKHRTALPNRLAAFVAGCSVRGTMYAATLGARPDTARTEASGAPRGCARLKMDITMIAFARGRGAA